MQACGNNNKHTHTEHSQAPKNCRFWARKFTANEFGWAQRHPMPPAVEEHVKREFPDKKGAHTGFKES